MISLHGDYIFTVHDRCLLNKNVDNHFICTKHIYIYIFFDYKVANKSLNL